MKKIFIFMFYWFGAVSIQAQSTEPQQQSLNPEFIRYARLYSRSIIKKTAPSDYNTGYVPHSVTYKAEIPEDFKKTGPLPSVYDLQDLNLVTSVKNQGNCGTCWAFASLGSIESRWLKLGLGTWYENNSSRAFDLCINAYVVSDGTGVDPDHMQSDVPEKYALLQNHPNPFNPVTIIQFRVRKAGPVHLNVYNLLGEEVHTLIDAYYQPGDYEVGFNASGLSSGIYMYRISMNDFTAVKKMVLME